jgi:hypothetical protein
MADISLTQEEREQLIPLQAIAEHAGDKRLEQRVKGLLKLADGLTINDLAQEMGVSPRTVHNWIARFTDDSSLPIIQRLSDKPRSGRPSKRLPNTKDKDSFFLAIMWRGILELIKEGRVTLIYHKGEVDGTWSFDVQYDDNASAQMRKFMSEHLSKAKDLKESPINSSRHKLVWKISESSQDKQQ